MSVAHRAAAASDISPERVREVAQLSGRHIEQIAGDAGLGRSTVYHFLRGRHGRRWVLQALEEAVRGQRPLFFPTPEAIRERLRGLGWSQEDLAMRSGLAVGTISHLCSGRSVSVATRRRVDLVLWEAAPRPKTRPSMPSARRPPMKWDAPVHRNRAWAAERDPYPDLARPAAPDRPRAVRYAYGMAPRHVRATDDLTEAASALRRVLDAVGRGELTAPTAMVRDLEVASSTLDAVVEARSRVEHPRSGSHRRGA